MIKILIKMFEKGKNFLKKEKNIEKCLPFFYKYYKIIVTTDSSKLKEQKL